MKQIFEITSRISIEPLELWGMIEDSDTTKGINMVKKIDSISKKTNSKEVLTIEFKESLSDSSVKLIKKILKESLGYETKITRQDGN